MKFLKLSKKRSTINGSWRELVKKECRQQREEKILCICKDASLCRIFVSSESQRRMKIKIMKNIHMKMKVHQNYKNSKNENIRQKPLWDFLKPQHFGDIPFHSMLCSCILYLNHDFFQLQPL